MSTGPDKVYFRALKNSAVPQWARQSLLFLELFFKFIPNIYTHSISGCSIMQTVETSVTVRLTKNSNCSDFDH